MSGAWKWNESTISRLKSEGYGRGRNEAYKAWLDVRSFSSSGVSYRVSGVTVKRPYTLFSNEEYRLFLLLDHQGGFDDIREQFPLDREMTLAAAREAGIRHPRYPQSQCEMVMTLDFLVIRELPSGPKVYGVSSKPEGKLQDERTIEKEEVMRRACLTAGIVPVVVSPKLLNTVRADNIEWIYSGESLSGLDEQFKARFEEWRHLFRRDFACAIDTKLSSFCVQFEERHRLQIGTGLDIAKSFLRTSEISTNLDLPDIPSRNIQNFELRAEPGRLVAVGDKVWT
jgi:hypothetical protein